VELEQSPASVNLPLPRTHRKRRLRIVTGEQWVQRFLIVSVLMCLLVGILFPLIPILSRSFSNQQEEWVGLANYLDYFSRPALSRSFANSVSVSLITTIVAVFLAFGYAFALTRTQMPGKPFFQAAAMLPLFAPSMAYGIGLVYLFGRKGLVTTGFLGYLESVFGFPMGYDIQLYGMTGIILGEVLYCFPQALMILVVAANLADARLYEASRVLRATPLRTFFTVTLPGVKYGLLSAVFVCFTLVFTDFGVPKVVGGNFNVLATDIYKQVIGQQNFVMGSTISILLLTPTVIAFILDRIIQRRQSAAFGSRAVPLQPKSNGWRDTAAFIYCLAIALAIIIVIGTVGLAALVNIWPYKLDLTLRHFNFTGMGGGGYAAFWNSLKMAGLTAVFGTVFTFFCAYLIEKTKELSLLRSLMYFLSMLPMALPGMVIGLAYIFFFNPLEWKIGSLFTLPNPLASLYGTMAILVLSNIAHFFTVSFLSATTALKQLDAEIEAVSASMAVPFWLTFWRVTVPLCLPAILEIAMYYFVNAMVTVSAVIFLYSPDLKLASVAIVNMDDAGDTAAAAAMSMLVILASVAIRMVYHFISKNVLQRTQAWKLRDAD
jgi:iron(III) transport system permease protein